MEITVIKIGKPALDVRPLIEMYAKRMQLFSNMSFLEWKDDEKLEKHVKPGHRLILLDERGKTYDSKGFAKALQGWIDDPGVKGLVFVIGGPYGFEDSTRSKAHQLIALSGLTFQGDIAWVVLTEQIYRAFTILKNIEYHH